MQILCMLNLHLFMISLSKYTNKLKSSVFIH